MGDLLVRSSEAGMGLADGVLGSKLVSVDVVAVLKGGGEGNAVTDAISVGSIGAPLANTVAVGSVDGGAGAVAIAGGRPGGETAGGKLVAVEGFSGGGRDQAGGNQKVLHIVPVILPSED